VELSGSVHEKLSEFGHEIAESSGMAELSEFSVFPVMNRRLAISEISSLSPLHKMADFELPELFALPKMADLKLPEPSASPKMANIEPFNLAKRPFVYLVFLFLLLPRFLFPPAPPWISELVRLPAWPAPPWLPIWLAPPWHPGLALVF